MLETVGKNDNLKVWYTKPLLSVSFKGSITRTQISTIKEKGNYD